MKEACTCGCRGAGAGGLCLGAWDGSGVLLFLERLLVEATREAQRAVQHQATELFGSEAEAELRTRLYQVPKIAPHPSKGILERDPVCKNHSLCAGQAHEAAGLWAQGRGSAAALRPSAETKTPKDFAREVLISCFRRRGSTAAEVGGHAPKRRCFAYLQLPQHFGRQQPLALLSSMQRLLRPGATSRALRGSNDMHRRGPSAWFVCQAAFSILLMYCVQDA